MQEQQTQGENLPFQSNAQLAALQIHSYWEKLEDIVLYPFRKLADYLGQTDAFREADRGTLKLVK